MLPFRIWALIRVLHNYMTDTRQSCGCRYQCRMHTKNIFDIAEIVFALKILSCLRRCRKKQSWMY